MRLTQSLHRAFQQHPESPMTISGDRVHTARETADRVARLAGGLRALGVAEDDRVAVLAANSDRYHEALYATWWAGAAVTAVNVRWSPIEIAHGLDDAGSAVLLVDDACLHLVPEVRKHSTCLTTVVYAGDGEVPEGMTGYEELISASEPVPDARRGGDDLAALIYTGGTTGFPKGVTISHRSMMTSVLGSQTVHQAVLSGGVTLVLAPLFHVAGLGSWNNQNVMGGTVLFVPSFEPGAVLAAIERHRVTTMLLVPTMLQLLVDHPDVAKYDLSSIRCVGYGAAPISAAVLERVMATFSNSGFYQGYGMTESGMITVLDQRDHIEGGPRLRSAGRVVPHAEAVVADLDGTELPCGEVGEILVRGDSVTRGYWNRPEETAAALRGGWMHTGDAGWMDEGGYIYIVDRLKDMIVTGGENVYSIEVENALAKHPAVAACAVVGLADEIWGERVHAVVVLQPGARATAEEIRDHTRTLIAGYKTPRSVEFADALPLSATGKILKRDLRDRAVR